MTYSNNSSFVSVAPYLNVARVIDFVNLNNPTCKYKREALVEIIQAYKKYAVQSDLNWVLAFSQCLHETGKLSSWWCDRPRRNPAGLGVTGTTSQVQPVNTYGWYQDGNRWLQGYTFGAWDGERGSVQSHLAHLLLYIYKDSEMTPFQLTMSQKSPGYVRLNTLAPQNRGCVKTLQGLFQTWAYSPNPTKIVALQYPSRITKMANELVNYCT